MAGVWLWLGSSNTKAYKEAFEAVPKRHFIQCTRAEQFIAEIDSLESKCDFVTISGLDNILADMTKDKLDPTKLLSDMDLIFQKLEDYRTEGLKIVVEPLIPWKKHSEEVKRAGLHTIKTLKSKYPGILFAPRPPSLRFAADGVHLVDKSSHTMFKVVKGICEDFFFRPCEDEEISDHEQKSDDQKHQEEEGKTNRKRKRESQRPQHDWNDDMDQDFEEENEWEDKKHTFDPSQFHALVRQFLSLKRQVAMNRDVDLLVHAGTKEDLDRLDNNQNMNKVVVSGLSIPEMWSEGKDWKDRVAMIKENVLELFKFVDPANKYDIGFVKHLNQRLKASRQIVEVTLETEKQGRGIRKALSGQIKIWKNTKFPECMNGVSISPSLTIATRVRIAILKAIAAAIKKKSDDYNAWVIQHVARPVLKIEKKTKNGETQENSFGFTQSIAYMMRELPECKLSRQDLFDAYTIAGKRFGPEIGHFFVLMDWETAESMAASRNKSGKSKKQKP